MWTAGRKSVPLCAEMPSLETVVTDRPGERSLQRKATGRLTGTRLRVSGCRFCSAVLGANNQITAKALQLSDILTL